MKNLVFNIASFDEVELIKTFPLPYYIGKIHNFSVTVVFHQDENSVNLPEYYKGALLKPLKYPGKGKHFTFSGEWYFFRYFFKHAKETDVLVRVHFSYQTAIIGMIYKWRNPKGIFYIFSDGYGVWKSMLRDESGFMTKIKNSIIRKILFKTVETADKVSIELAEIYDFLKKQKPFLKTPEKLTFMRWGIDEEIMQVNHIKELPVNQKEKLIISVGRHGSKQKNTELFLDALKKIALKDYKVVFIGPIEKVECDFQDYINAFFNQNPHLKDNVCFIGPVYDKATLYNYFNRSKIFVHTAVYESYGIVIGEAFRFNNYIVSTDTGCAKELISEGMGELVEYDANDLSRSLQRIIDGEIDIYSIYQKKHIHNQSISWENEVMKLGHF